MIRQFEQIITALRRIPNVEIIETSDDATGEFHQLAAVVVDFEEATISEYLEDGTLSIRPSFSLAIHQALSADRKTARRKLNELTKKVLGAIAAECGAFQVDGFYPQTVPFGNGYALAYGMKLTLPETEYDLS
jgi:hypothetical protein